MKVKELMTTELITVPTSMPITEAVGMMEKEGVSRLLVEDDGKIVGILTERDVVKRLGSWKERRISSTHIRVSSVYTQELIGVSEDDDVSTAARIMLDNNISSLVVRRNGDVVGLVTKTDLIKSLIDDKRLVSDFIKKPVTIRYGSSLLMARKIMMENGVKRLPVILDDRVVGIITEGDIARFLTGFRKLVDDMRLEKKMKEVRVEDVMSRDLITVGKDATIGEVVKKMLKNEISSVLVVEEDKLLGIVTKTDLLKALL